MNTELMEDYKKYLMPTYAPSLVVAKANGSRVYDDTGKQYYDFTAGIGVHNVGHCTDGVVKAVQEQVAKLGHCSNYFASKPQVALAKKLVEISGALFPSQGFQFVPVVLVRIIFRKCRIVKHGPDIKAGSSTDYRNISSGINFVTKTVGIVYKI